MNGDIGLNPGAQAAKLVERLAKEKNISPENAAEEAKNSGITPIESAAPSKESTLPGDIAILKASGKEAKHVDFLEPAPTFIPEDPMSKIQRLLEAKGLGIDRNALRDYNEAGLQSILAKIASGGDLQDALAEMKLTTFGTKDVQNAEELGVSAGTTQRNDFQVMASELDKGTSPVIGINSERKAEPHSAQGAAVTGPDAAITTGLNNADQGMADLMSAGNKNPQTQNGPTGGLSLPSGSILSMTGTAAPEPKTLFEEMTQNPAPRPKGHIGTESAG